jgi:cyanophycinase
MTAMQPSTPGARPDVGRLLVIGGHEDPDGQEMVILPHFLRMCGGTNAHIIVCGTPSSESGETEREYGDLFRRLGAGKVTKAKVADRPDAERKELLDATREATGVFFTGGDQLRLTSTIAGTAFGELIQKGLYERGLMIGGTSAGAAAMGTTMLIGGTNEGTVKRNDIKLAAGLGYWRDTTIDTHFAQRGRVNRLCVVFGENPQILCVGIDENTAIEVHPGRDFCVIGEGAVFVFDGKVTHSNASEVGDEDIMAVTDVLMHVLPAGYGFNLTTKRPSVPDGTPINARS